jgi:hypothetical protein
MRSATVKAAAWLCYPDAAFHLPRASHRDPGDPPLRWLLPDDAQAATQSKDVPASGSKNQVAGTGSAHMSDADAIAGRGGQ